MVAGQARDDEDCEIDLQVGGVALRHGSRRGGFEVAFHGEYQEIVDERLVNTEVSRARRPRRGRVNTNLRALEGVRPAAMSRLWTQGVRDMIIGTGMETGAQEGLDIIDEIVAGSRQAAAPAQRGERGAAEGEQDPSAAKPALTSRFSFLVPMREPSVS